MYLSTNIKIKLPDRFSSKLLNNTGIKQGDGLSLLIFNIFMNYLNNIFDQACDPVVLGKLENNNLLYADDLLLISNSEKGLQNILYKLNLHCQKWQLEINMRKTKNMFYSKW